MTSSARNAPGASKLRPGVTMPIIVLAWIAVVSTGMALLWRYEHTPGALRQSPVQWPAESRIAPASDQPTLLLFAHPKCPCTRASMGELAQIMTACRDRVITYVLFVNGRHVGSGESSGQFDEHDVTGLLRRGRNIIAVKATRRGSDIFGSVGHRWNNSADSCRGCR